MTHFIWGFLNTKTYTLVIFLHMMNAGVKIPIWIWIIDANFQLTNKLSKIISDRWMHWLELFYHQHRMAHLPKVIVTALLKYKQIKAAALITGIKVLTNLCTYIFNSRFMNMPINYITICMELYRLMPISMEMECPKNFFSYS